MLLLEPQRDDTNFKELEQLITQDAHLTFMLLKYTNSALFHHRGSISTIGQALNTLGLNVVRAITMTILLAWATQTLAAIDQN